MFDICKIESICKQCINMWGLGPQLDMVIEECSELSLSVCHFKRDRNNLEDLLEEAVDVMLMAFQVREISKDKFNKIFLVKLNRLEKRLNEQKTKKGNNDDRRISE